MTTKDIKYAWNNRPMAVERLDMMRMFHYSEVVTLLVQIAKLLNVVITGIF